MSNFRMPSLFLGHGSPMNLVLENTYTEALIALSKQLPLPKAILVISAHWLTRGTHITAMNNPKTIHDFGGFPEKLFQQQYPASGSPEYAKQTADLVTGVKIDSDHSWGLDHGTWSVLLPMYPDADIPVYQLSIDYSKPPQSHYEIGKELKSLRNKGVLILGSGNIVHNLGALNFSNKPYDWAIEFDSKIKAMIDKNDHQSIINFQNLGVLAKMAHPTYDHLLPLLYILALKDSNDEISYFNESFDLGSISMRSLVIN